MRPAETPLLDEPILTQAVNDAGTGAGATCHP
jgi:hypothetical protein